MADVRLVVSAEDQSGPVLRGMNSALDSLKSVVAAVGAAFSAYKLADWVNEVALLAARYDTLGISMRVVGNNAGYTGAEMDKYQTALQKTGISAVEARQNLMSMASAHMNLADSAKIARIAQDAAVIGNINSSEAFARLTYGIESAQIEVLRTIGINVNFEDSYKKLATQLHKNAADLTDNEKLQARVNVVMEKGRDISGTYEAAMGTAGKQLNSLKRYFDDLKVAAGEAFQPMLTAMVEELTIKLKMLGTWFTDNKDEIAAWGKAAGVNLKSTYDALVAHKDMILLVAGAYVVLKGTIITVAAMDLMVKGWSGLTLAITAFRTVGLASAVGTLAAMATPVGLLVIALTAAAAAWAYLRTVQEKPMMPAASHGSANQNSKGDFITPLNINQAKAWLGQNGAEEGMPDFNEQLRLKRSAEAKAAAELLAENKKRDTIMSEYATHRMEELDEQYKKQEEIDKAWWESSEKRLAADQKLYTSTLELQGRYGEAEQKKQEYEQQDLANIVLMIRGGEAKAAKEQEWALRRFDAHQKDIDAFTTIQTETQKYQDQFDSLNGKAKEQIDAESKLRDGLLLEETLRSRLVRATLAGNVAAIDGLAKQVGLQDQLNQRLKDELTLRERKGVLTGEIVGFSDSAKSDNNPSGAIYKNGFANLQGTTAYVADKSLMGGSAAATAGGTAVSTGGVISGFSGNQFTSDPYWNSPATVAPPVLAVGTPYVKSDGLAFLHTGEAVLTADQNKAGGGGITISGDIVINAGTTSDPRTLAKMIYGELQQLGSRYQR